MYFPLGTNVPRDRAIFDPRGMNGRSNCYVELLITLLHTKQTSFGTMNTLYLLVSEMIFYVSPL